MSNSALIAQQFASAERNKAIWRNIIYNVKDYGAKGDGTTDDTSDIQSVLNYAKTEDGITVIVPPGTYRLTQTLRIYSNTHLILEPGATFLRGHEGSMMFNGDTGASYPAYNGNGNITIEGGVWEGNISEYVSDWTCFGFARASNVVFRNLEIRDIVDAHAMDLNGMANVLIEECRFLGYKDTTGGVINYYEAIQLAPHNEGSFGHFGPFDSSPCKNITVRNCYFGSSGTEGTTAYQCAVGNHFAVYDVYCSDIKIIGNTFESMTFAAVRNYKFQNCYIQNNTFLNCLRGVAISNAPANTSSSINAEGVQTGLPQSGKNCIISGNVFTGPTLEHIYCYGQAKEVGVIAKFDTLRIVDNVFENQNMDGGDDSGLSFRWVNNLIIENNDFKTGYRFIYLEYCSYVTVRDNQIDGITRECFYNEEATVGYQAQGYTNNIRIQNNRIMNAGRAAISLQACDRFDITGNEIFSVCTETDNSRDAISLGSASKNGKIVGNKVTKGTGNQNRYGIAATATCDNIQLSNNDVEGKTGRQNITATNSFDGVFITATNGTRYKVTVSTAGAVTVTAG